MRLAALLLLCGVTFWWSLGSLGLIDPDEPFYAQSSREMLVAHDWVTPRIFGQPQFEKPILIYWLTMASFRAFGETEFAARVPAALFATLLVFMTWAFASRVASERAAFLAAVILATSLEFFVSARMLLTDMVLAAFACGAVFALWLARDDERRSGSWLVAACALTGLAVLTKGPLGLLLPAFAAVAMFVEGGDRARFRLLPLAAGALIFAAVAVPWYAIMLRKFGSTYFNAFFIHENVERFFHAEHPSNDHFWYYPAVLAAGSFPWIPALPTLASRARTREMWDTCSRFLGVWGILCLAFLTLAHSKLPSYVLFLFVPLALLLGKAVDALLRVERRGRLERSFMAGLGLLQAAVFLIAPRILSTPTLVWPLATVGLCLTVALATQIRRVSPAWIATTASSSVVLLLVSLGWAGRSVEPIVSVRPLSREIVHGLQPNDTLLASPLLARGVSYYTRHRVSVLSDRVRPFYTPHPLPVVRGADGLKRLLASGGSTVCVTSSHDWGRLAAGLGDRAATVDTLQGNVVARLSAREPGRKERPIP